MSSPGDVRLTVLGPLQIHVDGAPIPLAGKLKHRLISRLALHPGRAVSTDVLIGALWGDDAPRTAKQSLHVHISHIRDRLREVGAERLVTTTPDGLYVLATERVVIDATHFEELIDQGVTALQVSNLRSARDQLRDAMSMWGDPFESLANDYGAMAQRQRLITVYERGVDAYTETLINLGETDEATALLRSALAAEPLREHPYEQLMRVYLHRGERARALEVYEQAVHVFDTQLNIEPSQTLRQLRNSVTDAETDAVTTPPALGHVAHDSDPTALLHWDANLEIDIGQSALFEVPLDSDAGPFVEAVRASAALSGRRVAHGRILQGATSPLSPIFELAGFDAEPGTSRSPQLRAQLFDRISHRLVQQHFLVPVLVLEGTENASALLFAYLSHALGRPGPPPFTVLLIGTGVTSLELPRPLDDAITQRAKLELATVRIPSLESARFDDAERSVLLLLSCASLPAATELIARASDRGAADTAAAVDRLVARRVVVIDADGRLSLTRTDDTIDQLGAQPRERSAAHQALAAAIGHGDPTNDPRRTVTRTHHLMHSLDAVGWSEASEALRESVDYLESLSAYDDIVALCCSGGDPAAWPEGDHRLALLVALGRAQMRIGQTDAGRATLERCLDLARSGRHGHFFGEALRALLEERAPQTLEASARALIDEALDVLADEASETRVQLMTDMANSWYFSDPDQAASWADRALSLARAGTPSTLARGLTGVIQAKLLPDNAAERLDLSLEAQHWARRADSTESLVLALTYEANALMELGELRRAGPPLRYAEALASEVQVPRFRWWAAAWTASARLRSW